jgi:cytochrome c oxidase subunit 4
MEEHAGGHRQSFLQLALVLAALLALTALSITVSRLDTGSLRILTALSVAAVKTSLVLAFFMHMRQAGRAVAVTFLVTIIILAIFIGFTFFDIAYR